jgi:mono/diheme cytochrome c family protein
VVGGFALFAACYTALGAISYHLDATDPIVVTQLAHQKQAEIDFMRQPFEPESLGPSLPKSAPADPLVAKGATIFAAQPCGSCHGEKGQGTAAAPRLVGVNQKFSSDSLAYLLHHPTANMVDGGMPTIDLNKADTDALVAYLRSLK